MYIIVQPFKYKSFITLVYSKITFQYQPLAAFFQLIQRRNFDAIYRNGSAYCSRMNQLSAMETEENKQINWLSAELHCAEEMTATTDRKIPWSIRVKFFE